MVEVEEKQVLVLRYKGGKAVTFAQDDMVTKHEDKWFLRLRPTNQQIVGLVSCHKAGKNASLTQSVQLQKLVEMRNTAAQFMNAPSNNVGESAEAVWEEAPVGGGNGAAGSAGAMSGRMPQGTYTVTINVNDTAVNVLLLDARRPKRSDLFIEAVPEQLTAVFDFLQQDLQVALAKESLWKRVQKQRTE